MKTQRIPGTLAAFLTVATTTFAGDLNVIGNLNVASNLTANVVTLQGATELSSAVLDFAQPGLFYRYTLSNDTTWVFTNHVAGRQIWLQVMQDDTGGHANTWPAGLLWPSGTGAIGSTSHSHFDVFKILDNGAFWVAQTEGLNYAVPCVSNCSYALQFDGSQNHVEAPYSAAFYPAALTAECWFKTTGEAGQQEPIIGAFNNTTATYEIQLDSRASRAAIFYFQTEEDLYQVVGGASLNDGDWHHVALVWDGSTLTGYVDGEAVDSVSTEGSLSGGSLAFNFGRDYQSNGPFFAPVIIDEVRLSNTARYTNHFDRCQALGLTNDTHTIALWRLNEGTGMTVTDLSGNGHTGTLHGAPAPIWVDGATCDGGGGSEMMSMRSGSSRLSTGGTSRSLTNSPAYGSSVTITDTLGRVWGLLP